MIEDIEALEFLAKLGTMTAVANRLRLSQSTVTKRIQALENRVGRRLIEPHGRHVRLTTAGMNLIHQASPLIRDLRSVLQDETTEEKKQVLTLAVSESAMASWLPEALIRVKKDHPHIDFILHAHRSLTAIERVHRGECIAAICSGLAESDPGLFAEKLFDEELVLVPSKLKIDDVPQKGEIPVMCIEEHSATWTHIERQMKQMKTYSFRIERRLESFFCLIPMAQAGFGHALVPLSLVKAAKIPSSACLRFKGFTRPVSLLARKTSFQNGALQTILKSLRRSKP